MVNSSWMSRFVAICWPICGFPHTQVLHVAPLSSVREIKPLIEAIWLQCPQLLYPKILSFEEGVLDLLSSHISVRDLLDYNDSEILVEVVVLCPEMLIDTD